MQTMEEEDGAIVPRQQVLLPRDDVVEIAAADESTEEEAGGFEFEFPLAGSRVSSPALADELFADGRIRPLYPASGRAAGCGGPAAPAAPEQRKTTRGQLGRLFMEETRAWRNSLPLSSGSTSSSSSTEDLDGGGGLEGLPPESYCVWAPESSSSSPAAGGGSPRPRKSASMGSSVARWSRISGLVVGRSRSDGGNGKLLFPPPPPPKQKPRPEKAASATEIGTVAAARRMAYYGAAKAKQQPAPPRRTFLPYREELVGFFASVNGITSRHPHPY